ncbi:uncharacterized protein LOC113863685 [Abrus precatorius]|uniref:Uncharacterized protein LOC113863685 n=1 Tax=Abrus precatorius TaxID=3816 RepID=A0A8B8LA89_ABRPR|nr:uncharacterized protein LOC113863685 [Abrus precatorius]
MELKGISGSLKKYWMRRRVMGYQRLHGSDRRRMKRVEVGGSQSKRRWRIKIGKKIKIPKISSPKKLVLWVRDAYMRMMLGFANSMSVSATGYGGNTTSIAVSGFGRAPPPKEYDEKMIVHIYKSLIMARDPNGGTAIVTTF